MRTLTFTLLMLVAASTAAHAGWPWGPLAGAPVCTEAGSQGSSKLCADGANGAFVAWTDERAAAGIYAQRIDAQGSRLWSAPGVLLLQVGGHPSVETVSRDGGAPTGGGAGAIVAWRQASGQLGAQRVSGSGAALWPSGGVAIGVASWSPPRSCAFAADAAGGLFAAWIAGTGGDENEIRAQHVTADGSLAWDAAGLLVAAGHALGSLVATPDGSGGVVLAWVQPGSAPPTEVRAQRLSPAGTLLWAGGVTVHSGGSPGAIAISGTGDGGAFLAWSWMDGAQILRLSTQRLEAGGAFAWATPGPVLALFQLPQTGDYEPVVRTTAGGDFLVGWRAVDTSHDLFAQRLSATGAKAWAPLGAWVCTGLPIPDLPSYEGPSVAMTDDGAGGAYFCFMPVGAQPMDVKLEVRGALARADGSAPWGPTGILVAGGTNGRYSPSLAVGGDGDALVTYSGDGDILAQRLHPDGTLGDFPLGVTPEAGAGGRLAGWPNPARGAVHLAFTMPGAAAASLDVVDAQGRRVCALIDASLPAGPHEITWDGRDASGRDVPAGLYFARLGSGGAHTVRRVAVLR